MGIFQNNQVRVLLVDDDEEDFLIIKKIFARIPDLPYELSWCSSFAEAKEHIIKQNYDVYLIDYRLGEHTGLELLAFAEPQKRSAPFILLTGSGDTKVEQESMKLGAVDYLVKGTFKADILARTLYYAIGRKELEAQRLQQFIEINRTKDEFISLASHQLRTPATGVKQYMGMVLEGLIGDITEDQRKILLKAYVSNERQLSIVSELLKVARLDAGKVKLQPTDVNIVELLSDVINEQNQTYVARSQKVMYVHDAPPIYAYIDEDKIRMVLENFLDNASKYSDVGKTVFVRVVNGDHEILVEITDQGVGIKQDDYHKLFGKFSRIYNPLSHHVSGTGLGLYWAKKIVDLHQGRISFVSQEDVGTTFSVYLPQGRMPAILDSTVRQSLDKPKEA